MRTLAGRALLLALFVLAAPPAVRAQEAPAGGVGADAGELVERRVVARDSTKSYAVFLPPGYDPGRPWPALVLMDPRGRALLPLERFRPAAGELGYVILSSYDTSSDEPTSSEDTQAAVEALLNDALATLTVDLRRLYLVGFSGTARLAWVMAAHAPDYFPAIVGFGGGLSPLLATVIASRGWSLPAFFGGAGTGDFNYGEMWATAERLARAGTPHALAFFPGGHGWPPESVATAAVTWLELAAQRSGLAPADRDWIRGRFDAARAEAGRLEAEGREHDAWLAHRRLAATFDGLRPGLAAALDSVRASADQLGRDRDVRRTEDARRRWLAWEGERRDALDEVTRLVDDGRIPTLARLQDALGLRRLHRLATDADTLAAQAASRALGLASANFAFYLPRDLLARGDTARAIRSLELAHRIAPEGRGVCRWFESLDIEDRASSEVLRRFCGGPAS